MQPPLYPLVQYNIQHQILRAILHQMLWAAALIPRYDIALRRAGAVLGYAGTLTAVTFGLARAISDARDIIV